MLLRIARRQTANLGDLLRGRPVNDPPFHGGTVGPDDVSTAASWSAAPGRWRDPAVLEAYERAFARYAGFSNAFAFASGRESLWAILRALELPPGAEVVVPGFTCVAVPNAVRFAGLTPVFADIELDTYGLDAAAVEARLTPRTGAVVLHHLFGLPCRDYEAVVALARRRGLRVIEDCAHSLGARRAGKPVGLLGDAAFFSTEHSKMISTVQGGVACAADAGLSRRLAALRDAAPFPTDEFTGKLLRNVSLDHHQMSHPGRWWRAEWAQWRWGAARLPSICADELRGRRPASYGRRLPAPAAALGLTQLAKAPGLLQKRRAAAARWDAWSREKGFIVPVVRPDDRPSYLRFPALVPPKLKRDLSWASRELGFRPGVWFKTHLHPVPGRVEGCPNADRAVAGCLNFPTLHTESLWKK